MARNIHLARQMPSRANSRAEFTAKSGSSNQNCGQLGSSDVTLGDYSPTKEGISQWDTCNPQLISPSTLWLDSFGQSDSALSNGVCAMLGGASELNGPCFARPTDDNSMSMITMPFQALMSPPEFSSWQCTECEKKSCRRCTRNSFAPGVMGLRTSRPHCDAKQTKNPRAVEHTTQGN